MTEKGKGLREGEGGGKNGRGGSRETWEKIYQRDSRRLRRRWRGRGREEQVSWIPNVLGKNGIFNLLSPRTLFIEVEEEDVEWRRGRGWRRIREMSE